MTEYFEPGDWDEWDISEIISNLYIGNGNTSENEKLLKKYRIKTLINVSQKSHRPSKIFDFISYKKFFIYDKSNQPIDKYFDQIFVEIEKIISTSPILIHCSAGYSRSPTVVIAYLMKKNSWKYKKANRFVKKKRSFMGPNQGFVKQLLAYERKLGL